MSLQEFKDWKKHPITKLIWNDLDDKKKCYQEILSNEDNLYNDYYDRRSAALIGAIQQINNILDIQYKEIEPEELQEVNHE